MTICVIINTIAIHIHIIITICIYITICILMYLRSTIFTYIIIIIFFNNTNNLPIELIESFSLDDIFLL